MRIDRVIESGVIALLHLPQARFTPRCRTLGGADTRGRAASTRASCQVRASLARISLPSPPVEFAAAYDANVSRIHGFFAFRVPSRQDAEDLTQQTFERALRAWPRYDPRRAPASVWLLAIARNCLID